MWSHSHLPALSASEHMGVGDSLGPGMRCPGGQSFSGGITGSAFLEQLRWQGMKQTQLLLYVPEPSVGPLVCWWLHPSRGRLWKQLPFAAPSLSFLLQLTGSIQMDKLLEKKNYRRLRRSFPGRLQIWKQGNPDFTSLFYIIPKEVVPYQLCEGTQTPCFCGCCRQTEAALPGPEPQHSRVCFPRIMCPREGPWAPGATPSFLVCEEVAVEHLPSHRTGTAFPDTTLTWKGRKEPSAAKRASGWSTCGNRLFLLNMEERGFINLLFI